MRMMGNTPCIRHNFPEHCQLSVNAPSSHSRSHPFRIDNRHGAGARLWCPDFAYVRRRAQENRGVSRTTTRALSRSAFQSNGSSARSIQFTINSAQLKDTYGSIVPQDIYRPPCGHNVPDTAFKYPNICNHLIPYVD